MIFSQEYEVLMLKCCPVKIVDLLISWVQVEEFPASILVSWWLVVLTLHALTGLTSFMQIQSR